MRRHAQLIIPGLYMGPAQSAMNKQEMLNNGITHVYASRLIIYSSSWLDYA
jgi:hypothetical protein